MKRKPIAREDLLQDGLMHLREAASCLSMAANMSLDEAKKWQVISDEVEALWKRSKK